MCSNEDTLRKRVYQFFDKNSDKLKTFTVNHFKAEGISRSIIYGIIQRAEEGIPSERRTGVVRRLKL